MRKGWLCIGWLLCLLLPWTALAELSIPTDTAGQVALADYLGRVNTHLAENGMPQVNSSFGCSETMAIFGITKEDNAEIPENVELTFSLFEDCLNSVELRVADPEVFRYVAAACLKAVDETMTWDDAMKWVKHHADQAKNDPNTSFEDKIQEGNGTAPRAYFAYFPNQWQDGVNWVQMTLFFPIPGSSESMTVTPTPPPVVEDLEGYNDIRSEDTFIHFETNVTPTPEADSPAWEELQKHQDASGK